MLQGIGMLAFVGVAIASVIWCPHVRQESSWAAVGFVASTLGAMGFAFVVVFLIGSSEEGSGSGTLAALALVGLHVLFGALLLRHADEAAYSAGQAILCVHGPSYAVGLWAGLTMWRRARPKKREADAAAEKRKAEEASKREAEGAGGA